MEVQEPPGRNKQRWIWGRLDGERVLEHGLLLSGFSKACFWGLRAIKVRKWVVSLSPTTLGGDFDHGKLTGPVSVWISAWNLQQKARGVGGVSPVPGAPP